METLKRSIQSQSRDAESWCILCFTVTITAESEPNMPGVGFPFERSKSMRPGSLEKLKQNSESPNAPALKTTNIVIEPAETMHKRKTAPPRH